MYITFKELRDIKHALPTGSVSRIAHELNVEEQTVRNYFGAQKYKDGEIAGLQVQPGPDGGIVHIEDTRIIEMARHIIEEAHQHQPSSN
ncbi:MAG: DNA-binding protein [Bacteroidetes bacterium]|nr:DNA-binding protein [Bacteroidota bacterium]